MVSVARLGAVGPRTRYQAILQQPEFHRLASELHALLRYPALFENGLYTVEVAARVTQLRKLIEELRHICRSVQVLRFGRDRMRTCPPTLSEAQHALLHRALAAGYFEVPRRITLTEFAKKLGRSKSAVSQALALVERELAESSVASSG